MNPRILIVEDDPRLAAMVAEYLGGAGMLAVTASTGETGLKRLADEAFDALVLDLSLPDIDGLEVCRRQRATTGAAAAIPILMLTARGEATDRIVGLELGADDYLPKPFEPRELLARLRAILRRGGSNAKTPQNEVSRYGRLEIDHGSREVRVDGEVKALTSYQYALLVALSRQAGRVLSRESLMEQLKGESLEAFDRSIDVHVSRIRQAIEDDVKKPRRILTVRGAGYVFARMQN